MIGEAVTHEAVCQTSHRHRGAAGTGVSGVPLCRGKTAPLPEVRPLFPGNITLCYILNQPERLSAPVFFVWRDKFCTAAQENLGKFSPTSPGKTCCIGASKPIAPGIFRTFVQKRAGFPRLFPDACGKPCGKCGKLNAAYNFSATEKRRQGKLPCRLERPSGTGGG